MGRATAAAIASIIVGCAGAPAVRDASTHERPASAEAAGRTAAAPLASTQRTGLLLSVVPADAQISVDGRPQGPASSYGPEGLLPLPPGLYQVTVSRAGYATWRAEVAVRSEPQRFNIVLERR